jgi:hypothetical protein
MNALKIKGIVYMIFDIIIVLIKKIEYFINMKI